MLYFGQVSPVILLVNLLIEPVQTALLLIGGAATLIAFVSPLIAQIFFWFDLIPLAWTIGIVRLFAQVPAYPVSIPPNGVAAFFTLIIGAAMLQAVEPHWIARVGQTIKARALLTAALIAGVGVLILIGGLITSRPDGRLHVWILNVGGGDGVLIQTPHGAHLLVDGGNSPSRLLTALGDRLPFTDQTIDVLLVTQPDVQQFGALIPTLDRYDWGMSITNGQPNLSQQFAALQAKLAAHPVVNVTRDYTLDTDDGLRIKVLNPPETPALGDSLDTSALVLRLTYGNVSFLLTSELSLTGQQKLLKSGEDVRAAVLQLPQGLPPRSLDTDFLAAVQPQIAVLQATQPDEGTLALLKAIPVYRPDRSGTIHLSTDGQHLWIDQEVRQ